MNRSGLGRGLAALLPDSLPPGEPGGELLRLAPERIAPNPYQPRRAFDDQKLAELAASLAAHGLLQPVTVRPAPGGEGYQLVAGERRWRAAQLAGLVAIPALLRVCSEREMLEMALVENLQREDINALEAAAAYRRCLDEFGLTQEELAARLGKSRAAVANTLRLLKLAPAVRAAVAEGRLSEGHARAILGYAEEARQVALARRVLAEGLSVRETERLAREGRVPPGRTGATRGRRATESLSGLEPDLAAFAARLQRALGTKVELRPAGDGSGSIVIRYYGAEDLERLAETLEATC